MDPIRWVEGRSPLSSYDATMILAFGGWNDAGEAATSTVVNLRETLEAETFATVDPEGYYDYQQVRPQITVEGGEVRDLVWPTVELSHAGTPAGDLVFVVGPEPQYRWRDFCGQIVSVAHRTGCTRVIALGALLADVPHTRPSRLRATASDPSLLHLSGVEGADYEGPTGIVGALMAEFQEMGIESTSFWATVPHYVSMAPNPQGMLALTQAVRQVVGVPSDLGELEAAADSYVERISDAMEDNAEVQAYVRMLEGRHDAATGATGGPSGLSEDDLPTGEELADELQRFLRSQTED